MYSLVRALVRILYYAFLIILLNTTRETSITVAGQPVAPNFPGCSDIVIAVSILRLGHGHKQGINVWLI